MLDKLLKRAIILYRDRHKNKGNETARRKSNGTEKEYDAHRSCCGVGTYAADAGGNAYESAGRTDVGERVMI